MATTPTPPRIVERPDPSQWGMDELLTLPEAARLFWPSGPLTVNSLRRAVDSNQLAHVRIARKLLTTRASILQMAQCATCGRTGAPDVASSVRNVDQEEQERLRQAVYGRRRRVART